MQLLKPGIFGALCGVVAIYKASRNMLDTVNGALFSPSFGRLLCLER